MKTTVLYLFLAIIFDISEPYRILGLFLLPSKGHMVMFENLMKGLAEKGYEVDVLSHSPQKKPIPRYNDISFRGSMPLFVNNISISLVQKFRVSDLWNLYRPPCKDYIPLQTYSRAIARSAQRNSCFDQRNSCFDAFYQYHSRRC